VTGVSPGDDTLAFQSHRVDGFVTGDITTKTSVLGMNYPVTVHVTPEPVSLALLTLSGLLLARRRA
jgi:hypothetical protein